MSQVRVIAIEPHDGYSPGDDYLCTERQCGQLLQRRLIRRAADMPPRNKMRPDPQNKGKPVPSVPVGEVPTSSPSPAGPVSPPTTQRRSVRGVRPPGAISAAKTPRQPRTPRSPRAA